MPQKILGNAWKERRPYSSLHVITALSLLDLRKFERFGASLRNPLLYQGRQKSMQRGICFPLSIAPKREMLGAFMTLGTTEMAQEKREAFAF